MVINTYNSINIINYVFSSIYYKNIQNDNYYCVINNKDIYRNVPKLNII
jgi:hypothetical protein